MRTDWGVENSFFFVTLSDILGEIWTKPPTTLQLFWMEIRPSLHLNPNQVIFLGQVLNSAPRALLYGGFLCGDISQVHKKRIPESKK
jgi:hypothetical protein